VDIGDTLSEKAISTNSACDPFFFDVKGSYASQEDDNMEVTSTFERSDDKNEDKHNGKDF